jgi:hypothetical protein
MRTKAKILELALPETSLEKPFSLFVNAQEANSSILYNPDWRRNEIFTISERISLPAARITCHESFAHVDSVGDSTEELYDAWHPAEILSLRQRPDLPSQYAEISGLEETLAASNNPFYLYGG